MQNHQDYSLYIDTTLGFEDAIERVTELLKEQGFGVLTEIDVQATMKKKLDLDYKPFRILGACNPPYANRVLSTDPHVSVLLPCNVVVWDEGDKRVITAMNPKVIGRLTNSEEIHKAADEIYERIVKVIESF